MKVIIYITLLYLSLVHCFAAEKQSPKTVSPQAANAWFDGSVQSGYFPGWAPSEYPKIVRVDMGETVELENIRVFDNTGQPTLSFFSSQSMDGSLGNLIVHVPLTLYGFWQQYNVSAKTRYIVIVLSEMQSDNPCPEIEFYVKKKGGTKPEVPATITSVFLNTGKGDASKIGACTFHWVPDSLLAPFAIVRPYIARQWVWREKGLYVNPSFQANANYDHYFTRLKNLKVEHVSCLNQAPDWLQQQHGCECPEVQLVPKNADPENAISYAGVAKFYFQWAARYGSNALNYTVLNVDTTLRWGVRNEVKTGLGLERYVEIDNEPDRWWKGPQERYTPEQYAALLSACYDGHEGKIPFAGVKVADSNMKVVLGGLSNFNIDYLEGMRVWFENNRSDKKFPCDVISVHHYCNEKNDDGYLPGPWTRGTSPEADRIEWRLSRLFNWRDSARLKHLSIWYTEFGYDTNAAGGSPQKAPVVQGLSLEGSQSVLLPRFYLLAIAAGVEKVMLFNMIDEPCYQQGGLWCSAGIANAEFSPTPFRPKPAWHSIRALAENLSGYVFTRDVSPKNNSGLRILEFKSEDGKTQRFFYWLSSIDGSVKKVKVAGRWVIATEAVRVLEIKRIIGPVAISKDKQI